MSTLTAVQKAPKLSSIVVKIACSANSFHQRSYFYIWYSKTYLQGCIGSYYLCLEWFKLENVWENGLVWHITENSNSKSQHVNFKKRFCFISNYLSLLLFSTLAPDEIPKACRYKGKDGKTQEPQWRDGGSGATYYPSHNISPQSFTWVCMYSRGVCILRFICWLGALQKFHGSEMLGMFAVKRKFVVWHGEKKMENGSSLNFLALNKHV